MSVTKFVIVEQSYRGRYVALRGLSFPTKALAEAHIASRINEKYRYRYHVETRKVKDIDPSQTMHCQCCNRAIHSALGTIAHHGYQRPGDGWQTASCFGAKRLPWEVDRSAVWQLIQHLKSVLLHAEYARCAVSDEIEPVTHYYQIYERARAKYLPKELSMTRDTFADIVKANVDDVFSHNHDPKFDTFKDRDLERRDQRIDRLKRDIKELTARYDGWVQTHKWEAGYWVAL
jgi:hypothetical protein